jgi:hypothetical protein
MRQKVRRFGGALAAVLLIPILIYCAAHRGRVDLVGEKEEIGHEVPAALARKLAAMTEAAPSKISVVHDDAGGFADQDWARTYRWLR